MSGGKFWAGNTRAAELTPAQVLDIRARYAQGETQGSLARAFGKSVVQIGRIVRGEVWQRVTDPEPDDLGASARRMMGVQEVAHKGIMTPAEKMAREMARERAGDAMLDEIEGMPTGGKNE